MEKYFLHLLFDVNEEIFLDFKQWTIEECLQEMLRVDKDENEDQDVDEDEDTGDGVH